MITAHKNEKVKMCSMVWNNNEYANDGWQ